MLLWKHYPNSTSNRWFAWRPIYAADCNDGRPGGYVWLETVECVAWDGWGACGWDYKRLPQPDWRQKEIEGVLGPITDL